jgi:hypothetical protein
VSFIVCKESSLNLDETNQSLPSFTVSLLQESEDVFPEKMPSGLPPIRGIKHQIDFVPGTVIPNQPACKSHPEETKELQRQVGKLMRRGYVRENISSCAVPVLLVPKKDGPWRTCVDCRAVNNITVTIRGRILLKRGGMMGPMVGRILKIPCQFQMGQSQGQERRRSRKQCKEWYNLLGPSLQIYQARLNIERRTEQYATQANKGHRNLVFDPGDWVWLHMRKERFPAKRRSKFLPRGDGPFQVLERINDNAYKLDLPGEYNVSTTFNVTDLSPFGVGDDLRANPFQEEGNDGNQGTALKDLIQVPIGPVTRARAKKFKDVLNGLVQELWAQANSWRPIEHDHVGNKESSP